MVRPRPLFAALIALLAAALDAGVARAQVHWDAGGQVGVMMRFATDRESGAPSPGFGPSIELQGHVALVPMVRVGAYLAADVSPAASEGPRTFWEGGLHARFSPPLLPWPWRSWIFAGFGYAYAYDFGSRLAGGLLDVPIGVGLGRKFSRRGLLFAELGTRLGFGFYGPMYGAGSPVGHDSVALSLSVGLSFEQ